MSAKKFVLFILSIIFSAMAFVLLVSAMVIHAIKGDGVLLTPIFAAVSFVLAFFAVITTCIYDKEEK